MSSRTIKRFVKHAALIVILGVGGYMLMPSDSKAPGDGGDGEAAPQARADAAYTIKFSAGASYQPGARPHGIGEPLQGLSRVIAAFEKRFPDTRVDVVNTPGVRE